MTSSATIPHSDIGLRRDGAGDRAIVFMHGFLDDQHVWPHIEHPSVVAAEMNRFLADNLATGATEVTAAVAQHG